MKYSAGQDQSCIKRMESGGDRWLEGWWVIAAKQVSILWTRDSSYLLKMSLVADSPLLYTYLADRQQLETVQSELRMICNYTWLLLLEKSCTSWKTTKSDQSSASLMFTAEFTLLFTLANLYQVFLREYGWEYERGGCSNWFDFFFLI